MPATQPVAGFLDSPTGCGSMELRGLSGIAVCGSTFKGAVWLCGACARAEVVALRQQLADSFTAGVSQERERCARHCDMEARLHTEEAAVHPDGSEQRSQRYAIARAALSCAVAIRSGEPAPEADDQVAAALLSGATLHSYVADVQTKRSEQLQLWAESLARISHTLGRPQPASYFVTLLRAMPV
jgi:hypothetical protein